MYSFLASQHRQNVFLPSEEEKCLETEKGGSKAAVLGSEGGVTTSVQKNRSVMGLLYVSILYDSIYCMYLLSGSHYLSSITDSTRVVK